MNNYNDVAINNIHSGPIWGKATIEGINDKNNTYAMHTVTKWENKLLQKVC